VRDSAHACSSLTGRSERRKGHGNTTRGRDEAAPEGQGSWGELLGKGTGKDAVGQLGREAPN
jgi:hypothetical protein